MGRREPRTAQGKPPQKLRAHADSPEGQGFPFFTLLASCYSPFPQEGTQEEFAGVGSSCPSSHHKNCTWVNGSSCPLFGFYFKAGDWKIAEHCTQPQTLNTEPKGFWS